MLVKGPFAVFFFYCMVIPVLLCSRKFKELFTIPHILAAAVIVGIPAAWFYLASQQDSGSRMASQMSGQLLIRILRSVEIGRMAVMTPRALVNFLPWLPLFPLLWNKKILAQIPPQHLPLFRGCRLGMLIGFVIIDLLPGGQARYTMPVIPLTSVLLGWVLSSWRDFPREGRAWKPILLGGFILACLTSAAGLIFVVKGMAAWIVMGLTIGMAAAIFHKRTMLDTPFRLCLVTGVLTVVIMLQHAVFGVSIIQRYEYRRPSALAVNERVPPGRTIYVLKPGYQPFLFYIRSPLKYLLEKEQINREVQYLLLSKERLEELSEQPQFLERAPQVLYEFPKEIRGDSYRLVKLNDNP
jgi:4-amino-4-deoxy-L-arabinose transferase-like glycosyltransferase